jgi:VanZ family protein
MAIVLFVGARTIGQINSVPPFIHKIEHVCYFGLMAVLAAASLDPRRQWLAVLAISCVGALDEWHQLHVPGRSASAVDWLVDTLAAAVAVYAWNRILRIAESRRLFRVHGR